MTLPDTPMRSDSTLSAIARDAFSLESFVFLSVPSVLVYPVINSLNVPGKFVPAITEFKILLQRRLHGKNIFIVQISVRILFRII